MRLTLMTDYALRLLMHVAQRPGACARFPRLRRLIAFPRQI
jgi:DNA-binding IscR family transcriptional regulator